MAGLLGTALAGAMMGGGQAVQWNAQSAIEQKRQAALAQLDHGLAMQRQNDSQQFTAGENQANRQHDTRLTNIRESGANSRLNTRIAADREQSQNDWQLVPMEGGGYAQYSPTRNEYREANLPEGAKMGATSDLSERQKYRLDAIADEQQAIRERVANEMREPTAEEKRRLGQLQGEYDTILGGGSGGQTLLDTLLAGEGSAQPDREVTAPPDSVPGIIQRERQSQQETVAVSEARREAEAARNAADAVLERIDKEMGGGAESWLSRSVNQASGQAGISETTIAEAQQVADQLLALDQNPNLSADQKRWIAERIMQLQDAGIPININQ